MPGTRRAIERATRARLASIAAEWRPGGRAPLEAPPTRAAWHLDGRARRGLAALIVAALAIASWSWWNGRPLDAQPVPVPIGSPSSAPIDAVMPSQTEVTAMLSAGEVVVHVAGAVRDPGVVRLPAGSRVADAIEAAGGATKARALASVNLARILIDGEQVLVGAPGPLTPPGGGGAGGAGGGIGGSSPLTSLNLAQASALEALPGIGPVLAQRIVDHRTQHGPFASVDALGDVTGIGPALLAQLRPLVTT